MATRYISTKLAIEGESEYRSAIQAINGEIKSLQSALRLTESEFQNNANSMAALTSKGEALNNLYKAQQSKVDELRAALANAQKAEQEYAAQKDELKRKIDENNKKLEELKKTAGDTSAEEKKLTDENRELNKELEVCEAKLSATAKGVNSWETQLNSAQIKLNDYGAQIQLNNEYLAEAEKSTDGCATSIDRFGERVEAGTNSITELRDALAAAGIIAALKGLADSMESCARSAITFESGMAGVKRTVGGSDEFIATLGEHFKDLSTEIPITTEELAKVATTAGQLGIAQDRVEEFTVVMAKLGTTTDLTADTAATMLAQFSNITGITDYERLGSTVADLGDATATTASKVVEMSKGMAAAASVAGLSATDILGISAAVGSLGIEAMAGSTAMSTLIQNIHRATETGNNLDKFASVAGMSAKDFRRAWGEDAAGALTLFINGLNDTERNGRSAIVVLDELGIKNVRQTKAILGLAEAGTLLGNTIAQAGTAWENNTALSEKAGIMYGTTEAKLTMLANAADNAKIAMGDKLTPAIGRLAEAGTKALNWLTGMIESNDILMPALAAGAVTVGVLAAAIAGYTLATKAAAAATAVLTAIMDANPFFLAATAVTALVAGAAALGIATRDASPSVKDLTESARDLQSSLKDSDKSYADTIAHIEATSTVAEGYIDTLRQLESQGELNAAQQQIWNDTLRMLVQTVPELSEYIDLQTGAIDGGTEALSRHVAAVEKDAKAQAYQERWEGIYAKRAEAEIELEENRVRLAKATEAYSKKEAELTKAFEEGTLGFDDYNTQLDKAHGEIEKYEKAVRKGEQALDDYNEKVSVSEEALRNLTEATEENTEASEGNADAQSAATGAISSTAGMLSDLAVAYDEAKASAEESIEKQIGLFDEFSVKAASDMDTIAEMQARWAEQTAALAQYTENLQKAAVYGIDEGLVKSLSDGSAESAGYLAAIIKDIEDAGGSTEGLSDSAQETVDAFNQSFKDRQQAMEEFSETAAALETDFQGVVEVIGQAAADADFSGVTTALEEAFHGAADAAEGAGAEAGANLDAGAAQGITENAGVIRDAAQGAADQGTQGFRDAWAEHSPSQVGAELGANFDLGVAQGITQESKSILDAAMNTAKEMEERFRQAAENAVKTFDSNFKPIDSKTASVLRTLRTTVAKETNPLPNQMNSVGQETINGMIRGMNNRSSTLYSTVTRIVNTAIARARAAAATASPSKKTTKIFEDVGEGMVVGLEHKEKKVADKAQSVVDNALRFDTGGLVTAMRSTLNDRMPGLRTGPSSVSPRQIAAAVKDALKGADLKTGDTNVTIYSNERLSEREAAREFKRAQRDIALGYA